MKGMMRGMGKKRKIPEHDLLMAEVHGTLLEQGYDVGQVGVEIPIEIGRDVNPDLVANKDGERLLIECKSKESDRFVKQLENMSKTCKTVLWLDIDTSNIELRGTQHLRRLSWQKDKWLR